VASTLVYVTAILSVPLVIATCTLIVEILAAALLPGSTPSRPRGLRPCCAVLIPAHNEENGIARTLASVSAQLLAGDRILVVADNCDDRTGEIARWNGAEVVERCDTERRGKGFALDRGVRELETNPPDVVVILDADCVVEHDAVDRLVRQAAVTGRPAQAAYTMDVPQGGSSRTQLAAFLFALKNSVRPRGLARLGLPCLLTGTGMAFPWRILQGAPLASGNIVEDMQLGIDLALAGPAPVFCPAARVRSELPTGAAGTKSQRTRWVHGHLRTLATRVPGLAAAAIRQRRPELLGLALELSVPPLSVLVLLCCCVLVVLSVGPLFGGPLLPLVVALALSVGYVAATLLAWWRFGREYLSAVGILAVPLELMSRLPILFRFLVRPQGRWIRTARGASS
jgi:cellulose synthase/poly-beta-1,6-N-acetylglucosamine synthase-like glycosyltransferase